MKRLVWLMLGMLLGGAVVLEATPGREVVLVVDTSNSMKENDTSRYTVILSQVIGDLLADGDGFTVVRMPDCGWLSMCGCQDGADSSLALAQGPQVREVFKARVDGHLVYNVGTNFAAPIRTALAVLGRSPAKDKLLLLIADAQGMESCDAILSRELLSASKKGVRIASIHLGSGANPFENNRAFQLKERAENPAALAKAVAQVYQRLLGLKVIATGPVEGNRVEVELQTNLREAFLVLISDGEVGRVQVAEGSPSARGTDLDYRGGGGARGLDGQRRTYRIVHLKRPTAGKWTFEAPALRDVASWILIQDSAIGLRQVAAGPVVAGRDALLEMELYDLETGERIPAATGGPRWTAEVGGRTVALSDDGGAGDRVAGDGIFTARLPPPRPGDLWTVRAENELLERTLVIRPEVRQGSWQVSPRLPAKAEAGVPWLLEASLVKIGDPPETPTSLQVGLPGGDRFALRDDGQDGDRLAGDGVFGGQVVVPNPGEVDLSFSAPDLPGELEIVGRDARLEILGRLEIGQPEPIDFGTLRRGALAEAWLDLSGATVAGSYRLSLASDLSARGVELEVDTGGGFVPLGGASLEVDAGHRRFPFRVRVHECPQEIVAGTPLRVTLSGAGPGGRPVEVVVPLRLVVVPETWLACWWPVIAGGLGLLGIVLLIHGFWAPYRFPPRLGLILSPEEDLEEGFFHAFRGQRGSRSGFHRDARLYLQPDFRLAPRAGGALARIRADRGKVCLLPLSELWRQNSDGTWEVLEPEERPLRVGVVHRDASSRIYFELRNLSSRES